MLDVAAEHDIVKKSGTWFSYKEERIGQGREQAKTFLEAHPEMLKEIEVRVKAQIASGVVPTKEPKEKDKKDS